MALFWAYRINFDLNRVDTEVPNKLKEKVRQVILDQSTTI